MNIWIVEGTEVTTTSKITLRQDNDVRSLWSLSPDSLERLALGAYLAALFALIAIDLLFTAEVTFGDDQNLYDAIYNVITSGRMIFPLHGQPNTMTVHPPLHYFIVGMIGRLNIHVYQAAAVPPLLWTAAIFVLAYRAPWPAIYKLAVLTGFTLVIVVYVPILTIRPEVHLLAAWFCGLLVLELARTRDWNKRYIFFGTFCIAFASGLHYWALPVNLGLPLFVALAWHERDLHAALGLLPSMVAGWLAFYVPYAFLFWIPDWTTIIGTLSAASGSGGVKVSIQEYFDIFTYSALVEPWQKLSIIGWMFFFPIWLSLPLFAFGLPVLFAVRRLRAMALCGAPICLFIYLLVPRKAGLFYTQPELTLYAVALTLVLFGAARLASDRVNRRLPVPLAAVVIAVAILYASKPAAYPLVAVRDDWDFTRSLGQTVMGRNALIGINTQYPWYMSGARYVYQFVNWGFSAKDLTRDVIKKFDAFVFEGDWLGNQRMAVPFPWLYLDGSLNLQAVVMEQSGLSIRMHERSSSERWLASDYALIYATPKQNPEVKAVVADRRAGVVDNYRADPDGDYVLASMLVSTDQLEQYHTFGRRSQAAAQILIEDNTKYDDVWLMFYIFDRATWEVLEGPIKRNSQVHEVRRMTRSSVPISKLPQVPYNDPIEVITDLKRVNEIRP